MDAVERITGSEQTALAGRLLRRHHRRDGGRAPGRAPASRTGSPRFTLVVTVLDQAQAGLASAR